MEDLIDYSNSDNKALKEYERKIKADAGSFLEILSALSFSEIRTAIFSNNFSIRFLAISELINRSAPNEELLFALKNFPSSRFHKNDLSIELINLLLSREIENCDLVFIFNNAEFYLGNFIKTKILKSNIALRIYEQDPSNSDLKFLINNAELKDKAALELLKKKPDYSELCLIINKEPV